MRRHNLISRKASRLIAEAYTACFKTKKGSRYLESEYTISINRIYDFLFDRDFDPYFCNQLTKYSNLRSFKELIMKIHTGESIVEGTKELTWEQRRALGQRYLHDLAESIVFYKDTLDETYNTAQINSINELIKQLELEGYGIKNGKLIVSEADVLDTTEEFGLIEMLYNELELDNTKTTFHHLALSEEHYHHNKWDDSISNSRKFLECILREVAAAHSFRTKGQKLDTSIYSNQKNLRSYLEKEGLLATKERETITSVYSLLSETGGHPNMAQSEQARLLRHLSLTLSQFVMLRLRGALAKST